MTELGNRWLKTGMIFLLTITAILLLWHKYGMHKTLEVIGHEDYTFIANDDRSRDGASVAKLHLYEDKAVLNCRLKRRYKWPYCEMMVRMAEAPEGIDLSTFDTVSLDIQTESNVPGDSTLRVFLRNYNPVYAEVGDHDTLKVNEVRYTPKQEARPLRLPLENFFVASWWIMERNLSPRYTATEMDNITMLAVATDDLMPEGKYRITINSIRFHGKWLSQYQVSVIVITLWVLSTLYYLADGYWRSRKTIATMAEYKRQLEELNTALDLERRELETMAMHDALTGVYNRVGLRNRLQREIYFSKKRQAPLSAAFIDLDNYKDINDKYGHDVGDRMLKELADFVQNNTRGDDFFCRWGGDEFILFFPGTDLDAAVLVSEKLRDKIAMREWPHHIRLNCSFGVAQMAFEENVSNFIKRADRALYEAKAAGRNCVRLDRGQGRPKAKPDAA